MSIDEIMTIAQHKDQMVRVKYTSKYGYINDQHGKMVYVGKTKVIVREPYTNDIKIDRTKIISIDAVDHRL